MLIASKEAKRPILGEFQILICATSNKAQATFGRNKKGLGMIPHFIVYLIMQPFGRLFFIMARAAESQPGPWSISEPRPHDHRSLDALLQR